MENSKPVQEPRLSLLVLSASVNGLRAACLPSSQPHLPLLSSFCLYGLWPSHLLEPKQQRKRGWLAPQGQSGPKVLSSPTRPIVSFFFFKLFIYLFIWLCWVFVAACGLFSLVVASRGYSSLWCMGFSLGGFSCCRARALGARASVVVALGLSSCGSRALERRLSSCGTWA